eukprot:GHVN01047674.1.p1 GENE.GHVN01047674.1~~GHVN01047674.1.p1  ORF type:complete len:120 (-),score=26.44 GHVN01047674.1:182-541(-)
MSFAMDLTGEMHRFQDEINRMFHDSFGPRPDWLPYSEPHLALGGPLIGTTLSPHSSSITPNTQVPHGRGRRQGARGGNGGQNQLANWGQDLQFNPKVDVQDSEKVSISKVSLSSHPTGS